MTRVAIVTGGTRGIGRAITTAFLRDGVNVAAVYASDRASASALERESAASAGELLTLQADAGDAADIARIVDKTVARWGRVDYLINNAAISLFAFLDEMTEDFLDEMIRVNFKGPVLLTQAVLPHMKRQRFGRVVNASSISGHYADVGQVAYGGTKAAIEMMTKLAAAELGPYGITVNAYAPGIIATDMTRQMIEERGDVQVRQIPMGSFGEPDDVAGLVIFLCSDAGKYITGEIIGVDGGMLRAQNPFRAIDRAST
ncbi:MAG: SDR family oxidoreductase [Spirochaetaceae bacterium]|nr:MAG: SDR family oxidoreductase [Spirochaetaceae bacterium]